MVKQFANFEVAEPETIGEILKPLAVGGPPIDPMQASLMKKLESGGNFDRDYVGGGNRGPQPELASENWTGR